MLLQRNLQNPIEKNSHHRRNETRIGTRWTRDHNQLQRNPHIPQLRDNTWTNNRKDGSTDVKQLIRETLSSHQRLANETMAWQWVVFNMWQLQEEDTESVRTPAVTSHWAFRDKGTRQTRNQTTTISNSTTTTKRKKEGPAARQRRRMKENIRRCLLTSNQRMWDRYAASTDSTNSSRRSKDASETQFSWAKPGDQQKRYGSRKVVTSSWALASIRNNGVRILFNKRWKRKTIKTECVSESTNKEGQCWLVSVFTTQGIRTFTSKRCTHALRLKNILHSSRVVSTPNLGLAKDPKVTSLESTRWENPTSVVLDEAVVDDPKLRGAEHEIQNEDPKRKDSLRKSPRCTMHAETTEASGTHVLTERAHELSRR